MKFNSTSILLVLILKYLLVTDVESSGSLMLMVESLPAITTFHLYIER
jgi:hypothetical protein